MFLAGLEIDLQRIRGGPLRRALAGWGITFVAVRALGVFARPASTASPTPNPVCSSDSPSRPPRSASLLPILHDSGELASRFGTEVLAGVGDR